MDLRELREKLTGSDQLPVVVIVGDHAYEINGTEEGTTDARPEFWIVCEDEPVE